MSSLPSSSSTNSTSRKRRSDTTVINTTSSSSSSAIGGGVGGGGGLSSSLTSIGSNKGSKLKVRIKRYHGVAQWVWGNHDPNEVCGICQSAYEGVAPGGRWPGEDCPVVWGKCSHSFHLQCVVTWLNGPTARGTCPICRQEWALEESPDARVGN